ncbi:unnamed protein product [Schistosoma mattheei]|uniref:Calcium-activated BK potassium channel alpha subunit n=2 Tax=Schistosoma mattheei TaxID=31246 RepID=A0AA85BL16_9TREM|nr:unnamed protein product [Schistosoma mattheei]
MPCIRDPFPWWLPLALSCSIVLITIFIGIFRWLYKIYSRHKRLKIRSSRQLIQYKQLSPMSIDNQRTLSLQSTNDDVTDDYPSLFADHKDDQEFDEFTESEENIDSMHKNCSPSRYLINRSKKLRRIKTMNSKKPDISTLPIIKINHIHLPHHHHQQQEQQQEQQPHKPLLHKSNSVNSSKTPLSDLQSSPSCLETQSDTTYINDFFTVKPTNNDILLSENSTPSYWEESIQCNWFVNWFKYTRLGMSARQQLNMKLYCERFTTVSYPAGKIMLTIYIVLSTVSWLFYVVENRNNPPVSIRGICHTLRSKILSWINFGINLFCLGYYILKLCAATDRVRFVLSFSSLIDIISIPPALCSVFETHRHIDLNFLRSMCFLYYVDTLTYLGVITSNQGIQSARIVFTLFTIWMVGSGIMHVIEHLGDFWLNENHRGTWSYFESCYFLLVTLSTVGYGDYVTHSTLGRLFICIFIPVAMGVSASFVPELFRNFNNNYTNSSDRYEPISGERHVIVCGNFDNESIRAFIKGFLYGCQAKGRMRINMVLLRPIPLDYALKAILSPYHAWVRYFVGTPNNPHDLARTKLKEARAAFILATPNTKFRDDEDSANIMQAIAIKARKKNLRVILQLHYFRNKCLMNNFPRWTYLANDMVVCMEELKLGLMAYNCLAPGFSTLIVNLLNAHGSKPRIFEYERWRIEYEYGFRMQLHDVGISHEFSNLFIRDLAIFVYEKWNLILLAIRINGLEKSSMLINPIEVNCPVNNNSMRAIVISSDYSSALNLQYYCITCEGHLIGQPCRCSRPVLEKRRKITIARDLALYEQIGKARENAVKAETWSYDTRSTHFFRHSFTATSPNLLHDTRNLLFDQPRGRSETRKMDINSRNLALPNNIPTRCVNYSPIRAPSHSSQVDRTGSFHWVPDIPLTRATLSPNQAASLNFNRHFLVCVAGKSTNGPLNLENFIMPLRFHWQRVRDIVILGDSHLIGPLEWVKLKNLPRIFIVDGDPCSFNDLHSVHLCQCNACVVLGYSAEEPHSQCVDPSLQDRVTLLCAMNIRSLLQKEQHLVHLTTELHYEKNAYLFSSGDIHENDYKLPVWFSEPFARGIIFSNTLLYSCLSSFFYNDNIFRFLRVLISGQSTDELEASFSVGAGLQQQATPQSARMAGVKVSLRGFRHAPFKFLTRISLRKPLTFKDVYIRCITCWQILCLGLYRWQENGFRYVIANPMPDTQIYENDMFYCFMPIDQDDSNKNWKFSEVIQPRNEST